MGIEIRSNYLTPLWSGVKNVTRFAFGAKQCSVFEETLRESTRGTLNAEGKLVGGAGFNGFFGNVGKAWNKSAESIKGLSYVDEFKGSFRGIGGECKALKDIAGIGGKFKGAWEIFGKRMPLIGNLIFAATELPNIYRAFTHPKGGLGTGLKEVVKSGLKIVAFAGGAAIGTALGGPIGGIIGGMAAQWLADKCLGKSFTEQEEEDAKKAGAPQEQKQEPKLTKEQATQEIEQVSRGPVGVAGHQGAAGIPSLTGIQTGQFNNIPPQFTMPSFDETQSAGINPFMNNQMGYNQPINNSFMQNQIGYGQPISNPFMVNQYAQPNYLNRGFVPAYSR